jgi:beta-glucosidase/6-phospho-beta-glucosidase/beta-galactosidase
MITVSFQIVPKGLRNILKYIRDYYGKKWDIVITENGFIDSGELMDSQRIVYITVSENVHKFYLH